MCRRELRRLRTPICTTDPPQVSAAHGNPRDGARAHGSAEAVMRPAACHLPSWPAGVTRSQRSLLPHTGATPTFLSLYEHRERLVQVCGSRSQQDIWVTGLTPRPVGAGSLQRLAHLVLSHPGVQKKLVTVTLATVPGVFTWWCVL